MCSKSNLLLRQRRRPHWRRCRPRSHRKLSARPELDVEVTWPFENRDAKKTAEKRPNDDDGDESANAKSKRKVEGDDKGIDLEVFVDDVQRDNVEDEFDDWRYERDLNLLMGCS